jgi:uncharacterized membrane protein YtjA (UPF0391 family)
MSSGIASVQAWAYVLLVALFVVLITAARFRTEIATAATTTLANALNVADVLALLFVILLLITGCSWAWCELSAS